MTLDTNQIANQLTEHFGLENPICKNLNTLANDAVEVTSSTGHFALKLYNPVSRTTTDVQWEVDLTLHLIENGAPVACPVVGRNGGYLQTFRLDNQNRVAVLFEWAAGEKPKAERSTYVLLGKAAALIHAAADTFTSELPREKYSAAILIDDQLSRMKTPLVESGQWQRVWDLAERMREVIANPQLDYGIIHNDLSLDNVHRDGDKLTVFDLDSAGESWRAVEPCGVLRFSEDYFKAWLEGYRSIREFHLVDERAVAAFGIISDFRIIVWKLGLAKSSRGKPLMQTEELPHVVDGWLEWERAKIRE